MAGDSVKLFVFYKRYNEAFGIFSLTQPNQNHLHKIINRAKPFIFFICISQFFVTTVAFGVFEATTMHDYGITFFTIICIIYVIFSYMIPFWQMEEILQFIENCEKFIGKSKNYSSFFFDKICTDAVFLLKFFVKEIRFEGRIFS